MTGYAPDTLTLAACRSLDLDVTGSCNGCNTRRQLVLTRPFRADHIPVADLWAKGRFTCSTCGRGRRLDALEIRLRGNMMARGDLVARWPRMPEPVGNVGPAVSLRQRNENGRVVISVDLRSAPIRAG